MDYVNEGSFGGSIAILISHRSIQDRCLHPEEEVRENGKTSDAGRTQEVQVLPSGEELSDTRGAEEF